MQRTSPQPVCQRLTLFLWLLIALLSGCSAATIETQPGSLGLPISEADMLQALRQPGRLGFTKTVAAHWSVPLSGLLNLQHPKAQAANLKDRNEAIEIYVYIIEHPRHGTFLIDSGVAESLRDPKTNADLSTIVKMAMGTDSLTIKQSTHELANSHTINGVFLTHIHLDHIMGLRDLPDSVPVYAGPGETQLRTFTNLFTQGTTNRLLGNLNVLLEWPFNSSQILDIFGDGSLFAICAPGHTPGTTAYLANTTSGLQLMLGDITHTRWGWENGVEAGTYSHDLPTSATSLAYMKQLANKLSAPVVHPGHQSLRAATLPQATANSQPIKPNSQPLN